MTNRIKGPVALIASCAAIFWPGAFIFSFPGVMAQYWQATFEVGRGAIGQTLFFVLAAVGTFMFLTGRWQEKIGPAWLTAIGGVLCGTSTIIVGQASSMNHVYLWAFLVGASSSFIYIPAITVVQQWYPLRRGLVSGVVSMVFGLSAAIMSPIFSRMLYSLGYPVMTLILGLVALVVGLVAAPFVQSPKVQDLPMPSPTADSPGPVLSLTVTQSLRTRAFWLLWFTWALAGAAGIAMVTLSTSFGISRGLSIKDAVLILTAFNLANGLSRLASGYLSDLFGRNVTMTLAFLGAGCAYLLLPFMEVLVSWAVLAAIVGFAFGTLFAVSAPLASDCFGMRHFGAIFGLVFTAYGFIAGALGPWLTGHLLDATNGNFSLVFICLAIYCFTSALLIRYAKPPKHTVSAKCSR
ncbi:MAG: MFS transporter [Thermodesulfobacteriota bacterium]|nr:MFS transporter [Thermodesulfobacteriota bacterium]